MSNEQTIVFTGGGTGGHVFPGLALAEYMRKTQSYNFVWVGSTRGAEEQYVANAHYAPMKYIAIPSGKFRRSFSLQNICDIFKVLWAIVCAKKILKTLRPACVVSIGSYVSVPVVIAAKKLGIPVISVVTDISISLSTKINARYSSALLFAYESIAEYYKALSARAKKPRGQMVHVAGLPLRSDVFATDSAAVEKEYGIAKNQRVLLVLGGSSGSEEINGFIDEIVPALKQDTVILHQTGKGLPPRPRTEGYIPVPFFSDNYGSVLSRADAALSRGGAGSLWELTSRAVPSVIIPLPRSKSRGDQIENAEYFATKNMVLNLGETPSAHCVVKAVQKVLYDTACAQALQDACTATSQSKATEFFSTCIMEYISYTYYI